MSKYQLDEIQTYMQKPLWWFSNIVANNPMASAAAMRGVGIDVPDNWNEELLLVIVRDEALRGGQAQAQLREQLFRVPIVREDLPPEFFASLAVLGYEANKLTKSNEDAENGEGGIAWDDMTMWGEVATGVFGAIGAVMGNQDNGGTQPETTTTTTTTPDSDDDDEILGVEKETVIWGVVIIAFVFIGGMVAMYYKNKEDKELKKIINA